MPGGGNYRTSASTELFDIALKSGKIDLTQSQITPMNTANSDTWDAAYCIAQAERCRRLAYAMTTAKHQRELIALAEQYEAMAADLSEGQSTEE